MAGVRRRTSPTDRGFTLAELLIVIVILGILAVVTVFAVRGITERGQQSACATEFRNLQTAQETHWIRFGTYADEATLVANGILTGESSTFAVTAGGGGASYDIAPVGGTCPQTGSGGDAAPPPAVPVVMPTASFGWHGGVTAWRYPTDAGGANEIVVIGGETGKADWVAADTAGTASPRRTHYIDITSLDAGRIDALLAAVNTNGLAVFAVYGADDTQPVAGSTATSVADYLTGSVNALASYPNSTFTSLGSGGLQGLFATTAP